MTRILIQSPTFVRSARRFITKHPPSRDAIRSTLQLLSEDAFNPRLRTHKLKGSLVNCWASSAGYDIRIVFKFVQHAGAEAILLLSIGTHDEVY